MNQFKLIYYYRRTKNSKLVGKSFTPLKILYMFGVDVGKGVKYTIK
jgi:hypothetical protein